MSTVHRITMVVVDHDDLSKEDLIEEMRSSYDLSIEVNSHESQKIEWEDSSPFNFSSKISAAAEMLFAGKESK